MISPESITRLAHMQGYPKDVEVTFFEPCAGTDWSHELRIVRGALITYKRFMSTPSLGEIAKGLGDVLATVGWLQA